jgi:protease I
VLKKAGFKTIIASNRLGECHGMFGGICTSDILLKNVRTGAYGAILYIGGPGSKMFITHPEALRIERQAKELDLVLGAICHATLILLQAGILKNKKATGSATTIQALKENGIDVPIGDVIVDDLLITATGPEAAKSFGQAIASKLQEKMIPF